MFQTQKVTRQMKKVVKIVALFAALGISCNHYIAFAQFIPEPIYIFELPTAGVLRKGEFSVESNFFKFGGLRLAFNLAPFKNFIFGASFGGTYLIGVSKIQFQKYPGILLKYRLIDEEMSFPAIALGVSTQGFGPFYGNENRFETFSPGVFLVGSKAFKNYLGTFDLHLGFNYSFEPKPRDRTISFYVGLCQTALNFIRLNLEYNANLDEGTNIMLKNKGLLNFSIDFFLRYNIKFGISLKDLLGNLKNTTSPERNLFFQYTGNF